MTENLADARKTGATVLLRTIAGLAAFAVLLVAFAILVPVEFHLWIKALHVLAVISWMAGMLYLPRLFVYHSQSLIGSEQSETFKVMERRLLRAIVNPAMVVTWASGLWLAWRVFEFSGGWLHAKIAAVVALSAVHGYLSAATRKFGEDLGNRSTRHWRMINEIPTLLMIAIVILVIVKPF